MSETTNKIWPIEPKVLLGCEICEKYNGTTRRWFNVTDVGNFNDGFIEKLHGHVVTDHTKHDLVVHSIDSFFGCWASNRLSIDLVASIEKIFYYVSRLHWEPLNAYLFLYDTNSYDFGSAEEFYESYQGNYASFSEFADMYIKNTNMFYGWPESAIDYFDKEKFIKDMRCNYSVWQVDEDKVYVFSEMNED